MHEAFKLQSDKVFYCSMETVRYEGGDKVIKSIGRFQDGVRRRLYALQEYARKLQTATLGMKCVSCKIKSCYIRRYT